MATLNRPIDDIAYSVIMDSEVFKGSVVEVIFHEFLCCIVVTMEMSEIDRCFKKFIEKDYIFSSFIESDVLGVAC